MHWEGEKKKQIQIYYLTMSRQCNMTVEKTNTVLGCIRPGISSYDREVLMPWQEVLMTTPLEYCASFSLPTFKKV